MTDQQQFWEGNFGDEYIQRNESSDLEVSNIFLFSKILQTSGAKPSTILEIGANIGLNIEALKKILPRAQFTGLEINKKAAEILKNRGVQVIEGAIEQVQIPEKFDLVFTKGVLIHLNPNSLQKVYEKLFDVASDWILFIEYYSRNPESIEYRGYKDKLFKRDFAGEFINKFKGQVQLINYGFVYHRDLYPQDDLSWFMMKKVAHD